MNATEETLLALKALADPVRLSILEFLWDPVSDGLRTEGESAPATSWATSGSPSPPSATT